MSAVRLVPLTEQEYAGWATESTRGYAEQQVAAGLLPAVDAARVARRELDLLLPQGLHTPSHHLWTVRLGETRVGHLWLQLRPRPGGGAEAYVFDIAVDPTHRGRGLGRATMLLAEAHARELGAGSMALNVFGHNRAARRLYDSLGYQVVRSTLVRELDGIPAVPGAGPAAGEASPRCVRLERLPRAEYARYREDLLKRRADALAAAADLSPGEARARVTEHVAGLLPRGRHSPGHALLAVRHGQEQVGTIWLQLPEKPDDAALVRDLVVAQACRGRGIGRAAVEAAVELSRERGARTLEVTRVGPDAVDAWLERLGFVVAATSMRKPLPLAG